MAATALVKNQRIVILEHAIRNEIDSLVQVFYRSTILCESHRDILEDKIKETKERLREMALCFALDMGLIEKDINFYSRKNIPYEAWDCLQK